LITPKKCQNIKRKFQEVSNCNDKKDSEDGDNSNSDSGSDNGSDSDSDSDGNNNNSDDDDQSDDNDDDDDDGEKKSETRNSSSSDNKFERKDKEVLSIRTTINEDNRKVINDLGKQGEDVLLKKIKSAFDNYLTEFLDKLTWLSNMRYIF
jgi:hypothetical protein